MLRWRPLPRTQLVERQLSVLPAVVALGLGLAMAFSKKMGLITFFLYIIGLVIAYVIFRTLPLYLQAGGPLVILLIFMVVLLITYIIERGFTINDGFLHGFGIGLLPPSIGTREAKRGIPKPPFVLQENMCVVVQPNVVTRDESAGVQLGNLFRITKDGAECLHRLPLEYSVRS